MAGSETKQGVLVQDNSLFNVGNPLLSGAFVGLLVGLALGINFWLHAMDPAHIVFAGALAVFCAVAGVILGLVVSKINPEEEAHS
ncbi:MAG: hypothetical protein HC876_21195 [Chloroflexaceae bacterium]|nr:hypothetical protein [Chloroflexaceae bacterium]NJO07830.1 hypothetical protein [Chloroflexaceae bacterium]